MTSFNKCKDIYGEYSLLRKLDESANFDFSFVVGAFNASSTIHNSITSLIEQDYSSFEIIIVDDGSSDKTFDLLFALYEKNRNIVIIKQDNLGLTASLNRCISIAKGEFIVRHDADDISYPNRLKTLKRYFENGDKFLMSYAHVVLLNELIRVEPRAIYFENRQLVAKSLLFGNPFIHGTFAFRKDFIECFRYDNSFRLAQDFELLLRVVKSGESIKLVPLPLYRFIKSANSVSYKRANEQIKLAKMALEKNGYKSGYLIASKGSFLKFWLKLYREIALRIKV
jgi:glycosyltransferase involved in cell wall biosynthesis